MGLVLTTLFAAAAVLAPGPADHAGEVVVQIAAPDEAALDRALSLGLDVWTEHPSVGVVTARVRPGQRALLDASGLEYDVSPIDLGAAVAAERLRIASGPPLSLDQAFFDDFHPYNEVLDKLDDIGKAEGAGKGIATVFDVGTSLEGRAIRGIRITRSDAPKGLVVTGGQHAREWISVATSTCIADQLVSRADEPAIEALLDQVEFIIVPIVNPDGYVYSWEFERFWRKNRRDGHGVDTNRNFGVGWGGKGSSDDPERGNYRGEAPFSEPEAAAIRDLVEGTPHLISHIDVHSFGQLVLFPWSFTQDDPPAFETFIDLSADIVDALEGPHGTVYVPLKAIDLYAAAGTMPDWTYGTHGLYSFTFELRPSEFEGEDYTAGFALPADQIRATCEEVMAAMESFGIWTATAEPGEPGEGGSVAESSSGGDGSGDRDGSGSSGASADDAAATTTGLGDDAGVGDTCGECGDPPMQDESEASGCGCASRRGGSGWHWGWLLLLPTVMRRRQRARARARARAR